MDPVPLRFKTGMRGMIFLLRTKDKGQNDQRKSLKFITDCHVEWEEKYQYLRHLKNHCAGYEHYRIYSSVNERDMRKAKYTFKLRQLECEHAGCDYEFYKDISNRFFSCLMEPGSRDESLFLLDCDTTEQYDYAKSLGLDIVYDYKTPNGRHIICHPFNPGLMEGEHIPTLQKDGLIYVG